MLQLSIIFSEIFDEEEGIEDDEDLEEADVKQTIESIKKQGGTILTAKQKKAKIQEYNR